MKTIKIENSYDIGDSFSAVTFENCWIKLINYLNSNKESLSRIVPHKDEKSVSIQSLDLNNLLKIINKVSPENYFKKNLIKTIKLNLKFNKETKSLEIEDSELNDINNISYITTYDTGGYKNEVFFNEDSLLINYRNLSNFEIQNIKNIIAIFLLNKNKTTKNFIEIENEELNVIGYQYSSNENFIVKKLNGDEIFEQEYNQILSYICEKLNCQILNKKLIKITEITSEEDEEVLLIPCLKSNHNLIYINGLTTKNEDFDIQTFINNYNNGNNNFSTYNYEKIENNKIITYDYSKSKLVETQILLKNLSIDELNIFKNSVNKYIFDNFVKKHLDKI